MEILISWKWFVAIDFSGNVKLSYYWFNRQELLQKANDRYHNCRGKEKPAKYYLENEDILRENTRNRYKNLSEEEEKRKESAEETGTEWLKKKKNRLK